MAGRGAGLIDPSQFPLHGSDMRPTQIAEAGQSLAAMGAKVGDQTEQIASSWRGLTGCYVSPQSDRVYALMGPAVTAADDLRSTLRAAGAALTTYSEALAALQADLVHVEAQAVAFRAKALAGVWIDADRSTQAGFGDFVAAAFDWVPGVDERKVLAPWYEDAGMVARNSDLLSRYDALVAKVSDAAAQCANSVQGLMTSSCVAPVQAYTAQDLAAGSWWGSPVTEDRNCIESVVQGGEDFGTGLWSGVNTLVGHDTATGTWSWGTAGTSWMGLANLVGSLAALSTPGLGQVESLSMWATWTGHPEWLSWLPDAPALPGGGVADPKGQGVLLAGVLGSLIGMDTSSSDPWHKWHEDGVATATTSVLTIGTFFIPGAGEVGGGLKGASLAGKAADVAELAGDAGKAASGTSTLVKVVNAAGHTADFLVPGGAWVIKGGVKAVTGLDDMLDLLRTGAGKAGDLGATASAGNPVAVLVDSLDHVPGNVVHDTPVSDKYFGTDANVNAHPNSADALHDTTRAGTTTPVREPVTVGAGGTDAVTGDAAHTAHSTSGGSGESGLPDRSGASGGGPTDEAGPDPSAHGRAASGPGTEGDNHAADGGGSTANGHAGVGSAPNWDGPVHPDGSPDVSAVSAEHRGDPQYDPASPLYDAQPRGVHDYVGTVNPDVPSDSGLTLSGRLVDPTHVPAQLQPYLDRGLVHNDNGVLRLTQDVEVTFQRTNPGHNWDEFTRQVDLQERAMNQQSLASLQHNRAEYTSFDPDTGVAVGRREAAAQNAYRELQVRQLADGLMRDKGLSLDAATADAKAELAGNDVLHGPDQAAGGNPLQFTGMGDRGVNRSLGRQWGGDTGNVVRVDEAMIEALSDIPSEYWDDIRPTVTFRASDTLSPLVLP